MLVKHNEVIFLKTYSFSNLEIKGMFIHLHLHLMYQLVNYSPFAFPYSKLIGARPFWQLSSFWDSNFTTLHASGSVGCGKILVSEFRHLQTSHYLHSCIWTLGKWNVFVFAKSNYVAQTADPFFEEQNLNYQDDQVICKILLGVYTRILFSICLQAFGTARFYFLFLLFFPSKIRRSTPVLLIVKLTSYTVNSHYLYSYISVFFLILV